MKNMKRLDIIIHYSFKIMCLFFILKLLKLLIILLKLLIMLLKLLKYTIKTINIFTTHMNCKKMEGC